jgi:hypothetical protein
MMRERGLAVDHTTVFRWVQRYAPEINKRMRPHLKMSGTSYRIDETYVKVGKEWKYLYRAVDSAGDTIEFMLSAAAAEADEGPVLGVHVHQLGDFRLIEVAEDAACALRSSGSSLSR